MDLKCAVRVVFAKWCQAHAYIYYKTILFHQLNESLQCANDCLKNLSKWTSTICEAPVVEVRSFVIWSALLTIALLLVKEVEAQAATLSQAISKTVWLIFCYLQKGYTSSPLSLSVRWQQENIYTNVKCLWNTRWDRLDEERRVT